MSIGSAIYLGALIKKNTAGVKGVALAVSIGLLSTMFMALSYGAIVGTIAVVSGILTPFAGFARGFLNGFKAALNPRYFAQPRQRDVEAYQALERQRRHRHDVLLNNGIHLGPPPSPVVNRNRDNSNQAINRRLAAARSDLMQYLYNSSTANEKLVEKLSQLQPKPNASFAFLSSAEITALEESLQEAQSDDSTRALLNQYKNVVTNAEYCCGISLKYPDEITQYLTIEYQNESKQPGVEQAWHYHHYDTNDYLLYVNSRPARSFADIPQNRQKVDGMVLQLSADKSELTTKGLKIYKGLHPTALAALSEALDKGPDSILKKLRARARECAALLQERQQVSFAPSLSMGVSR